LSVLFDQYQWLLLHLAVEKRRTGRKLQLDVC